LALHHQTHREGPDLVATLLETGGIFERNILGFIVAVIASVLLIGVSERTSGCPGERD